MPTLSPLAPCRKVIAQVGDEGSRTTEGVRRENKKKANRKCGRAARAHDFKHRKEAKEEGTESRAEKKKTLNQLEKYTQPGHAKHKGSIVAWFSRATTTKQQRDRLLNTKEWGPNKRGENKEEEQGLVWCSCLRGCFCVFGEVG